MNPGLRLDGWHKDTRCKECDQRLGQLAEAPYGGLACYVILSSDVVDRLPLETALHALDSHLAQMRASFVREMTKRREERAEAGL